MSLFARMKAVADDARNKFQEVVDDPSKIGAIAKDIATQAQASAQADFGRIKDGVGKVKAVLEDPATADKLEGHFDAAIGRAAVVAEKVTKAADDLFKSKPPGDDGPKAP